MKLFPGGEFLIMTIKKSSSLLLAFAASSAFAIQFPISYNSGRSEFKLADMMFVGPGKGNGGAIWTPFAMGTWNGGHSTAVGFGLIYKQLGSSGNGAGDYSFIVGGANVTPVGGFGTQSDLFIAGMQIDDNGSGIVRSAHLTYAEGPGQTHLFIPSYTLSKGNVLGAKSGMAFDLDLTEAFNYVIRSSGSSPSIFTSDVALSTKFGAIGVEGDYTFPTQSSQYNYYLQATTSLLKNTGLKVKYDRAHDVTIALGFRF